ncbi:MAG TPA: PEGA domain-containing protein [Terriglobia bacterium]|nr:PEGA domain-containing protein [Terriglobia bacterium]
MTPFPRNLENTKQVRLHDPARHFLDLLWHAAGLSLLLVLASGCLYAQAAAEYGGATSGIAGSISGTNLMRKVPVPDLNTNGNKSSVILSQPTKSGGSNPNYIFDSMKQGSVAENRKALEDRAGKNAAKLMLRSTPTQADVKIDGKPVGKTPILLVLSPGQYDVVMHGQRMDHAEQKVDLLPNETREFLLPLKQLYPTSVKIQLH